MNKKNKQSQGEGQSSLPIVGARRINYPAGTRKNTAKSMANLEHAVKTIAHESRDGSAVLVILAQDGRKIFQVIAVKGEVVARIGHGALVLDHQRLS